MSDPFVGVALKLRRARDQINALDVEVKAYLDGHPYIPSVHFYRDTRLIVVRVKVVTPPPPMWSVQIGEIIHNLRSALDHIVWHLVIKATNELPARKQNQFPIFLYEDGFNGRGENKFLVDVSAADKALIKLEQPFATQEHALSPLWHLKELSDEDKHRRLHLAGKLVKSYKLWFAPLIKDVEIAEAQIRDEGPIEQGDAIWSGVCSSSDWPFASNDVDATLAVDVAFDQRTPSVGGRHMLATLSDVYARTGQIAKRIARDSYGLDLFPDFFL